MNSNSSTDKSLSNRPSAETISRRAYELWEQEGRPEGADLRHWLQAEQELNGSQGSAVSGQSGFATSTSPSQQDLRQAADTRPLQGTRGAAAATSPRTATKQRGSQTPFGSDGSTSGNGQSKDTVGRRRN
jgi:hypothetical protein